MENNYLKSEFVIDLKGYFPETVKDSFSGNYYSDFVEGYRSLSFFGTKDELDLYLDEIMAKAKSVKIIGITDKADTLIEFKRIYDLNNQPTHKIMVSDIFYQKNYIFPEEIAQLIIPDEGIKLIKALKDNPSRRYVRKDLFEEFILNNLKNIIL